MTDFRERARTYTILSEGGTPSNWSAWSPDLPGCVGTGDSLDACETEMLDAIAFHLEGIR
jgi:predicted RNase H-like HicB family nuclease